MDEPTESSGNKGRVLGGLAGLLVLGVLALALGPGCPGTRPSNLGVTEGKLLPPPDSPNCVSSQADPGDETHYVAPIDYADTTEAARGRLLKALGELALEVIDSDERYVYAQATSALFKFVDDVEFYFPADAKQIHCRSASRLGRSDFGVNRKRIEAVRAALRE